MGGRSLRIVVSSVERERRRSKRCFSSARIWQCKNVIRWTFCGGLRTALTHGSGDGVEGKVALQRLDRKSW